MAIRLSKYGDVSYVNEHKMLLGRDAPNQHPILSITGLQKELNVRYIKPAFGIPPEDLKEKYLKEVDFEQFKATINLDFAEFKIKIKEHENKITANKNDIKNNYTEIQKILANLDLINNKLGHLEIPDELFPNGVHIEQVDFTATDSLKVFTINNLDEKYRVIEPTILKQSESGYVLCKKCREFNIEYTSSHSLNITFEENGVYKINYITGRLTDSEFNVLLEYIKKLENMINTGVNGGGTKVNPKFKIRYEKDELDRVVKEIYTGGVNKTVEFTYNSNNDITRKTVSMDDKVAYALYTYDDDHNLIGIDDTGTDIPLDGTRPKKFKCTLTYNSNHKVVKEEFTGEIEKIVTYSYNVYGDIIKKVSMSGNNTYTAIYTYDNERNLIGIEDSGTEDVTIVYPDNYKCPGSDGTHNGYELITIPEIDLLFEVIKNE